MVGLLGLLGFASLAVDFGRVMLAKAELQTAADAAARYAVAGLRNEISGVSAAYGNAAAALAESSFDGGAVPFVPQTDLQYGFFDEQSNTFTPNSNVYASNAVRITLTGHVGSNTPLTFLSLLGRDTCRVRAESIAMLKYNATQLGPNGDGTFEYFVPATSNPWLAGMPEGTVANPNNPKKNPDYAGVEFVDDGVGKGLKSDKGNSGFGSGSNASSNYQLWGDYASKKASPIRAGSISIVPGATLTFAGLNGGANNSNSKTLFSADGNINSIVTNRNGAEHGKSDIKAPINSLIAVFLSDDDPSLTPAPPRLDFSTAEKRNFQVLKPQLKQTFFIGDGRRSNGEVQQFVVPPGATRLYLATMDAWEWNNNVGGFYLTMYAGAQIVTVR